MHQYDKGRFTRKDVDNILKQTWSIFEKLLPDAPQGKTHGSRQNIAIGVLSLAVYRALVHEGVSSDYATELFTDSLWKFYEKWAVLPRFTARIITRDPQKQMELIMRMFLRYPFSPPGYEWKVRPEPGAFALDIYRCPVHDYFKEQGEEEVTFFRDSWCTLDYAFAEAIVKGGRYERPHALSDGDTVCDMKWTTGRNQRSG